MTAVKEYVLHCDYGTCADRIRCVESRGYGKPGHALPTLAAARKWAHKRGWRTVKVNTIGGRQRTDDRCPRHKP